MAGETNKSPFEVNDFRGGITDSIYDQDYTVAAELDNFNITPDADIMSRPGSVPDVVDDINGVIPDGNVRIGTLINYGNSSKLLVHSSNKLFYRNPTAYATLQGPTGNEALNITTFTQALSYSQWNRHIFITSDEYPKPIKVYRDSSNVFQLRSSALPYLATDPTITPGVGANSYLYAFHYHYTYTAGPQTFEDFGPTTRIQVTSAADPGVTPVSITGIPVLSNGATGNWDTAAVKVFIYRSEPGGTQLYKVGEVTNGTTSFNDNTADADVTDGLSLYTNDGTLDFDPAPSSKYVHVVNNIGYYGAIKDDSGSEFPFRLRQSCPGDPDSCPEDFFKDLEDDIRGVSSIKSIPLVFCNRHVYRIENNFDQFGRGDMNAVRISDTAGCVSNLSIVQAENYCFWAGNDGFYMTDGYQVKKISDSINTTYKNILAAQSQQTRIYGKFDESDRKVLWAIQRNSSSLDNDSLIVLDLRWGVRDRSTFTTWSGNSFAPTALEFFNKQLYRADRRGYVLIHDDSYDTDPKIDTTQDVDVWTTETIIWTYKSIHINFGSTFFRKMPTRILVTAANIANTSIQITANNDDGKKIRDLKIIRWRRVFVWGDPEFYWGSPDCVWNQSGLIEQWRRFPAGGLRLSYVQIIITNAYSVISNSDSLGECAFDGSANTVTLLEPTSEWRQDVVDYYISTEVDGYQAQYRVNQRTSDTVLTLQDSLGTLPTGTYKWLLQGYQKGEPINLLSYNIFWENISQTQQTYEAGDDGGNS